MPSRMMVNLKLSENLALQKLAEQERRDPRAQAAYLIRLALVQSGYLQPTKSPTMPQPTQETDHAETG